jgi:hypothetical protein
VPCPQKLDLRTVVGTSVADGRSCGPTCACATTSCSTGGSLDMYTLAGCVGLLRSAPVDGTCATAGATTSAVSYSYTAATGCAVSTQATTLGIETITAPRTLCCTF